MLSIIIAVCAYTLIDISKTIQKVGIHKWKESRLKGGIIWGLGILGGTISSFLILYAVSIGSVVIVGALAGIGLVGMMIIARITLHERVNLAQMIAIAAIIAGPFLMAGSARYSVGLDFQRTIFWIFLGCILLPWILSVVIFRKKRRAGIVLAVGGGILSGLVVVFQKLAGSFIGQQAAIQLTLSENTPDFLRTVIRVMLNPYSAGWILLSVLSTIALQFAHKREMAIRSIPLFNAGVILTPVLSGIFIFSEQLRFLQWCGVASILIGIGILILKPPQKVQDMV